MEPSLYYYGAFWERPDIPRKGWNWLTVEDLGDLIGNCEMCGTAIRYQHILCNPDYMYDVSVGCVCAEHMTEDYTGPRAQEKSLKKETKKYLKQKKRWYEVGWYDWLVSVRGNTYINVDLKTMRAVKKSGKESTNVVLIQTGPENYDCRIGIQTMGWDYPTAEGVRLAIFEYLWKRRKA